MSEWIDARNELPEDGESIFFTRCGTEGKRKVVLGYRLGKYWQDQKHNIRLEIYDVFHWQYMKIPDPPKQDGPFRAFEVEGGYAVLHYGKICSTAVSRELGRFDAFEIAKRLNKLWLERP